MRLLEIANGLLFYVAWLGACTFAAQGSVWLACLAPLAVVGVHLAMTADRGAALRLIGVAALMSVIGDTLVLRAAGSQFAAHWPSLGLAPAWVVALWMAFATLPNMSMRWFRDRLALTTVLAAVFGPLTYWFGAELGAGHMGEPLWRHALLLAALWALAAPLLLALGKRWERPVA